MDELREYFENTEGVGVLATADSEGKVDQAIYARPHVADGGQLVFVMMKNLSHENLQSNPFACYLFMEKEGKYQGKRIYLKMTGETEDAEIIESMKRRCCSESKEGREVVAYFEIQKVRPLVGG